MIAWKRDLISSVRGISLPQSLVPSVGGTVKNVTAPASTFWSERPRVTSDLVSMFSTNVSLVKALMNPLSLLGFRRTWLDRAERSSADRNFC